MNIKNSQNCTNYFLNFLKGLACIGIVFIHVPFPNEFGIIIKNISKYGVPIFYLTAGFFSFGKGVEIVRKRLFKIIRIFILAYMIFFLLGSCQAYLNCNIGEWIKQVFEIKALIKLILFCTIDFAIPLWYLIGQIEVYILWYFVVKCNFEKRAVRFIPLLFLTQLVLIIVCETFEFSWFWKVNFLTSSFSWFILGYFIHSLDINTIYRIKNKSLIIFALIGAIITCMPVVIGFKIKFSQVGVIILSVSLFLFAVKNSNIRICRPLEKIGEELSVWVYIFHVPVSVIINFVFVKMKLSNTMWYSWILPILTVIVVISFAYIVNKAEIFFSKRPIVSIH